ncbi:hypothetical protein C8F04DRAFT_145527 [Mycena alexandri]|uniref:Uncharacterized protein n=1 Tax=Mycena alexandri TaxID=1745969 RepID=A0AAD6TCS3_9AGAR|nr:hypothetical protein C8F04DRAFT_145527 [Mycena alexandri]
MPRGILPTVGACAILTVDPVASLDPDTREFDPEAVAACKNLPSKKYLAFVHSRLAIYQPWEAYNQCIVHFILRGEPNAVPDKCIEPSMSIPIEPMTSAAHVSGRVPLKPSTPLPWDDCYITSFSAAFVNHPTAFTEDPIDYVLDREELRRVDLFLADDVRRNKDMAHRKEVESAKDICSVPQNSNPSSDSPRVGGDDEDSDGDSSGPAFDDSPTHQIFEPTIVVNFTHDLSTMDGLGDPADYFKEVEAIAG